MEGQGPEQAAWDNSGLHHDPAQVDWLHHSAGLCVYVCREMCVSVRACEYMHMFVCVRVCVRVRVCRVVCTSLMNSKNKCHPHTSTLPLCVLAHVQGGLYVFDGPKVLFAYQVSCSPERYTKQAAKLTPQLMRSTIPHESRKRSHYGTRYPTHCNPCTHTYTHTRTHTRVLGIQPIVSLYTHTHTYIHTYARAHTHTHTHTHTHMHTHTHTLLQTIALV